MGTTPPAPGSEYHWHLCQSESSQHSPCGQCFIIPEIKGWWLSPYFIFIFFLILKIGTLHSPCFSLQITSWKLSTGITLFTTQVIWALRVCHETTLIPPGMWSLRQLCSSLIRSWLFALHLLPHLSVFFCLSPLILPQYLKQFLSPSFLWPVWHFKLRDCQTFLVN